MGLPGGLGRLPSAWFGCGKVLKPPRQDAERLVKKPNLRL